MDIRRHAALLATLTTAVLVWAAVAGTGCGDATPKGWEQPLEITGPIEAGDRLVYVNKTLEQLQVLEPGGSDGDVRLEDTRVPTGPEPGKAALSPDESTLFVINTPAGEESLSLFDLEGESIERTDVDIDGAYDRITVDPEGEFLILSFSGSPGSDCVACNLNELGIVDLRPDTPETRYVTLEKQAQKLNFAPKFELGGESQRLVAAMSPSEITVIDLLALLEDNRDDGLREVPLTQSQAERIKNPTRTVFDVTPNTEQDSSGPKTIHLYVLTDSGNDVTQITVKPTARPDSERKFDVSVNQLAAGRNPTDMAILDLDEGTRMLTLDGNQAKFHLVDVQSGEGSSFSLPINGPATDMLVYNTVVTHSDREDEPEVRVLAYSDSSPLVAVIRPSTISIADDNPTVGRSVEAIRLDAVPDRIEMDTTVEFERAIAVHRGARAGFSVLNLQPGRNSAISIQGESLADLRFAGPVAWGVFQGSENFGRFDLERGHPTTFPLPRPGRRIFLDEEDDLIVVEHDDRLGAFTVVDAGEPKPERGRLFEGVFVRDLFERPIPDR